MALDAGVDATRIPEALGGGRADSTILQEFMVKFATRDYTPDRPESTTWSRNLNGVQDLARKTGTAMPLTACLRRDPPVARFRPAWVGPTTRP